MNRKQRKRVKRFQSLAKYYPARHDAMVRDGFKCKDCRSASIDRLTVHHKDENRKNDELINLVTLCRRCHAKRHGLVNERPEVVSMRASGLTFKEIGEHIGVSKQRAHQIYSAP